MSELCKYSDCTDRILLIYILFLFNIKLLNVVIKELHSADAVQKTLQVNLFLFF